MRNINHIVMTVVLLLTATFSANTKEIVYDTDTITLYRSFDDVLHFTPDTVITAPVITPVSEWDIEIKASKEHGKQLKKQIQDNTFAVCVGDTLWLVNGNWLKKHCHSHYHSRRYMPFFFSDKIAFFTFYSDDIYSYDNGIYFLYDHQVDEIVEDYVRYHVVDVENEAVELVDAKALKRLLARDFPDMLRRYESIRDHEHPFIVNQFFEEYIDRLHQ